MENMFTYKATQATYPYLTYQNRKPNAFFYSEVKRKVLELYPEHVI